MKQNEKLGLLKNIGGFLVDRDLSLYSASLSFNIFFTLIPFLMLGFYIATFLPFFAESFEAFRGFLVENFVAIEEDHVNEYITLFMQNYQEIGIIGFFAALYTNYSFISSFDHIAQKVFVCEQRTTSKLLARYGVIFVLIILTISIPLTALVALKYFGVTLGFDIFPLQLFLSGLIIFKLIPNRHIDYQNAITASIVSTVLIELLRMAFIGYVMHSKSYATIYGSFAALFLFFMWINISNYIFLLSMKICAFLQNHSASDTTIKQKGIN
jgi:membrane protein